MDLTVPERAITAVERLHGLVVTLADFTGHLWPHLDPQRLTHRHPRCLAVKALGHAGACMDVDWHRIRDELAPHPEGLLHRCHAGLLEWVVPGRDARGDIAWVLFAGTAAWIGPGEPPPQAGTPTPLPPWRDPVAQVDAAHAELVLECLRQLAARLERWQGELTAGHVATTRPGWWPSPAEPMARRRELVLHWIQRFHTDDIDLTGLGRYLHLSPGRAGRLVRSLCGEGFPALLARERLATACTLLRQTDLGVAEVAVRSGFGDVGHFHRAFRAAHATTPARWRERMRAAGSAGAAPG